jgi:hypothetical protein
LVLVKVLKFLSKDIDGTSVPVSAEKSFDFAHLNFLVVKEIIERYWLFSWGWKLNE